MADHDDDSVKVALLAHDLRTPLAAMRLTAELIGNGPLNDTQAEHLSILIRSIDALTEMTGDLIGAQEAGAAGENACVRVGDIVSEVADLFHAATEAKALRFEVSADDKIRTCVTRQGSALRRVFTALLDNAVKYTSEGGISVNVREIDAEEPEKDGTPGQRRISLTVTDSGPGIEPEERARLFRPFVRGRHGKATGPGTGLGLWGTAELVREMHGRLRLSQPEEGGSRFDVEVPVETEGAVAPQGAAGTNRPQPVGTAPQAAVAAHVLVVDDNETNCRLLAALIESFGMTCDIAHSGEQAIGLVQKDAYDAVLLDLHMPGMSGVEAAGELGKLKTDSELPLIAVTAALESIGDEKLREAGFREIVTKPLSPAALYAALESATRIKSRT